jgi:uncharacterized membrane protein
MFYSPETCGGEGKDFEMMGWWKIETGSCALVFANDLEDLNRFWYYFAESHDGAVWSGPFDGDVSPQPFGGDQWCQGQGKGDSENEIRQIGFRELDIGDSDDFTLTFVE